MSVKSRIISFFNHHPKLKKSIMPWITIIYQLPKRLLFILFSLFPIHPSKVVISNFGGKDYGDNSKYVAEALLKEQLFTDIAWMVGSESLLHENHLPKQIRPVKNNSLKGVYEYATAKVWIDNTTKSWYFRKRRGQIYIQLWHGTTSLKKILRDVPEFKFSKEMVWALNNDSDMCDLLVSGSDHRTKIYHSAFDFPCPILESGSPKNDLLVSISDFDSIYVEQLKLKYGLDNTIGKRVLLYAPTYRRNLGFETYTLDIAKCCLELTSLNVGDWICLLRLHPIIAAKSSEINMGENVIDVSNYPDMQELLCISDVLITDYSSSMFDFILTKRPCFLYTPDAAEYQDERGYYMKLDELPFPRGNTNDELIKAIQNFDYEDYRQKISLFIKKIGIYDKGNAGKAVVDWIKLKISSE